MDKQRLIFLIISFCLFLAWGVYSTSWYETGQLVVHGVAERAEADLTVLWDSGEGYNEYESRKILVNIPHPADSPTQHIRIRGLQEKHPSSESANVSIIKIIIDGEEFDLKSVRPRSIFHDRLAIQLTPGEPVFEFDAVVKRHIRIVFANSYYFGKVAVEINGVSATHDLYTPALRYEERPYDYYLLQPDGSFQFELELPRYELKTLVIKNNNVASPVSFSDISLCGQVDCRVLDSKTNSIEGLVYFQRPNKFLERYYDPVRFWFRVIFALANVWLVWSMVSLVHRSGGVIPFFFHKRNRYFWGLFLAFGTVNCIVLAPFWPGVMSLDSLYIWRAAGLPEVYLNSHPVLNLIFYMYLRGIWNNPAVVPLTQIVLSSLLIAYGFEKIRKSGVSTWLLAPPFLLLLFSLPILLYNTALWKDIPFALLVVAWGMHFAFTLRRKEERGYHFSLGYWCVFLLGYVCLGFFRHNGLVYLVIVPLFWVVISPFSLKKGAVYSILAIVLASAILWGMAQMRSIGGLDFLSTALTQHTMFWKNTSVTRELVRTGKDYFRVFDMAKEGAVSDKWHFYLQDRYAWNYFKVTDLSDYYPYQRQTDNFPGLKKSIKNVYMASYEKPWKYLIWNPLHMLILLPFALICFRWLPASALFSAFLLCGIIPLLALNIFNWRYYYFFFFGLYFILPLILFDLQNKKGGQH